MTTPKQSLILNIGQQEGVGLCEADAQCYFGSQDFAFWMCARIYEFMHASNHAYKQT